MVNSLLARHLKKLHFFTFTIIIIINLIVAGAGLRKKRDDRLAEKLMLTHKQKEKVTKEVKRHEKDSGSPEYQIALFTERIKRLTSHLKINKKDFTSRRGLLKIVAKRRKLLEYLKKTNEKSYKNLMKKLGLK